MEKRSAWMVQSVWHRNNTGKVHPGCVRQISESRMTIFLKGNKLTQAISCSLRFFMQAGSIYCIGRYDGILENGTHLNRRRSAGRLSGWRIESHRQSAQRGRLACHTESISYHMRYLGRGNQCYCAGVQFR